MKSRTTMIELFDEILTSKMQVKADTNLKISTDFIEEIDKKLI